MIKYIYVLGVATLCLLSSCQRTDIESGIPEYWLVSGNYMGLRNEFIDMANIIEKSDSSLTVFSLVNDNFKKTYSIRDSVLIGPSQNWIIRQETPDSIFLVDNVKDNFYLLTRLKPGNKIPHISNQLVSYPWVQSYDGVSPEAMEVKRYFFSGDSSSFNCSASIIKFEKETLPFRRDPPHSWSLHSKFGRDIIIYTIGNVNFDAFFIDSIIYDKKIFGHWLSNYSPNETKDTFEWSVDTSEMNDCQLPDYRQLNFMAARSLTTLEQLEKYTLIPTFATDYTNNDEYFKGLELIKHEVPHMRFEWDKNFYNFFIGQNIVRTGHITNHPKTNILMLDHNCSSFGVIKYSCKKEGIILKIPIKLISSQDHLDNDFYTERMKSIEIDYFIPYIQN